MSANQYKNNNVSIRLRSGGHSFSPNDIAAFMSMTGGEASPKFEIVTPKTTLVPAKMFDKQSAEEYLAFVGIAPADDEVLVFSEAIHDKVAVMAMNRECHLQLSLTFGSNMTFTSPLIEGHQPMQGAIVELVDDVLYVRIFNGQLIFGEAVAVANDADLRYVVEKINRVYNIYNMHVRARGNVDRLVKCCDMKFKDLLRE